MATAICRRAYSPLRAACLLLLTLLSLEAGALQLAVHLGAIRHPVFAADGVRLKFDILSQDRAEVFFDSLRWSGREYRQLRLVCADFKYDGESISCPRGQMFQGGQAAALPFALLWQRDGRLQFSLKQIDATRLLPYLPELRAWQPSGRLSLALQMAAPDRQGRQQAQLQLQVEDFAFSHPPQGIEASQLAGELKATAMRQADNWQWQTRLDWQRGMLHMPPWRRQAGMQIEAEGLLSPQRLDVALARLDVVEVGAVSASLVWDRQQNKAVEWGLVSERIDLQAAMDEWLQPWLAQLGFPAWQTSGSVLFSVEWGKGKLQRFYAGLQDARIVDSTGYLELNGINAHIPWESENVTQAEIRATSGRFGDLPLGAFNIPLSMEGDTARVETLSAPLLDGRLLVEKLLIDYAGGHWQAEFSGGIEALSMPKLSATLGLPQMAGNISAMIPRIAYADEVLQLDGALGIEVFDGGVIVHQLRVFQPFSEQRRLRVNVNALGLDLGLLTRTFDFGSIEGRFDIALNDLEMAGWTPLRFDARIVSSEGEYPRILSLGALQDITELGTTEDGSGLRQLPKRSIGGFAYKRIGLGCQLRDGVCLLSGIEGKDTPEHILIMEGGGFPSIDILGYNRQVDWDALVKRFREVIAGQKELIIQ